MVPVSFRCACAWMMAWMTRRSRAQNGSRRRVRYGLRRPTRVWRDGCRAHGVRWVKGVVLDRGRGRATRSRG